MIEFPTHVKGNISDLVVVSAVKHIVDFVLHLNVVIVRIEYKGSTLNIIPHFYYISAS